jgi:hypothetical protein
VVIAGGGFVSHFIQTGLPQFLSEEVFGVHLLLRAVETALLNGQGVFVFTPYTTGITAAKWVAANRRLLLEAGHSARIGPARAVKPVVVLVTIFLQPPPHMAVRLMAAVASNTH